MSGTDFRETCFVAHVTPVTPATNVKAANASVPFADGTDALFAALLDGAPQIPGGTAQDLNNVLPQQVAPNISATNATQIGAQPQSNVQLPAAGQLEALAVTKSTSKDSQQQQPANDSAQDALPDTSAIVIAMATAPARPTVQDAASKVPTPQAPKAKNKVEDNPALQVAAVPAFMPPPQIAPIPKPTNNAVSDSTTKTAQPVVAQQAVGHAQSAVIQTQAQVKSVPQHEQSSLGPQTAQNFSAPAKFDVSNHAGGQNAQSDSGEQHNPQSAKSTPVQPTTPSASSVQAQAASGNSNTPAALQTAPIIAAPALQVAVHTNIAVQPAQQNPNSAPMSYDVAAMAITIAAKLQDGDHHFDIRLDPPELGSIAVHLTVNHTGQAAAHLTADKPETLQLLQNDSGNLQSALKDAGLNLSNNGLNFSLRGDQRQAGQSFQRGNSRTRNLTVNAAAAPTTTSAPISSYAPGALDITI